MKDALEAERPLRELELSDGERRRLRSYSFLSEKPVVLVVNMGESEVGGAAGYLERTGLAAFAGRPGFAVCPMSAPIEAEMSDLAAEDARAFRQDLGLAEPGLDRLVRTSYSLLGLVSFLTAGEERSGRGPSPAARAPNRRRAPSIPTSSAASSARSGDFEDSGGRRLHRGLP